MSQRDPETYAIIGAAMEVHKQLGYGFLEAVYQEALAVEMSLRQIPFEREVSLPVFNYLKATGYATGLLLNFGAKSLEYKRFANTRKPK